MSHGHEPHVLRWALLGAGVLTAILVVYLALTGRDAPLDAEGGALPEPKPPEHTPLVAPGKGDVGWLWLNPQPRAMPSWYDVDVAGPDRVAMVGLGGEAARFDGGRMYRWPTESDATLHAVVWWDADEALAVGDAGTVRLLRRAGEAEAIASGTDHALRDIIATGTGEALAVGDGGTLLRITEGGAEAVGSGTDADLLGLHHRGGAVWMVGARGTLLRMQDGKVEADTSGTDATLRAVGGCRGGDLYAAGDDGRLLRRTREGLWERIEHPLREPLSSIACDRDRAVVVGLRGGVLLVSGRRTVVLDSGTDRALHGVDSGPNASTWMVGDGGRLLRLEEDHVAGLTAGPTSPIRDMSTIGGALVAVGEWGRILREHEDGLRESQSPTKSALAGVARLGEDAVVAVGDYGAIVRIRWDEATLVTSPTGRSLRDVVSDGTTILAVGTEGTIVRGELGALRATALEGEGTLWGLAGDPDDALAVGDEGLVLRVLRGRTQRLRCDVEDGLRAVVRDGPRAWAVGERGIIVRIEGNRCVVERPASESQALLEGVGLGPYGEPYAVGRGGTVLERTETGTWERAEVDIGPNHLRAVVRTARDVYLVGSGGVILRHVLLDGT